MSDIEDLERALRDERTQRYAVERRLVQETDKARIWRQRAEERAARIRALEAGSGRRRRRPRKRNTPAAVPVGKPAVAAGAPTPLLPVVRVGAAVRAPDLRRSLDMMTVVDMSDPAALHDTDLVVVEAAAWHSLPKAVREAFIEWSAVAPRQPLVVWTSDGDLDAAAPLTAAADVVAATGEAARRLGGRATAVLSPTFDPQVHNPRLRLAGTHSRGVLAVDPKALGDPPPALVTAAACGTPVVVEETSPDELALSKAAVAARRWAYRHHAPWVRAAELLDAAGVAHPDPLPSVAAIVVSKRPRLIEGVVRMMAAQTHAGTEIVVGVHGADPSPVVAMMDRLGPAMRWQVRGFDAATSLGECLNATVEATGAAVLAKIDDDDYYGPAYLEDAVHALLYSGAGIVGKGAQYTYLQQEDRTVLRRPGDEEKLIGGTPTGAGMVWRRGVWEKVRFPHRPRFVDRLFVAGARTVGEQVYANSRWEFRLFRSEAGHTYEASAAAFLAGAEEAWPGDQPDLVEVADLGRR